ncbi:hypothetical protein CASFOL_033876 [Castilleja foliolosa]|uniref:F-box domain-containing protein n=1 Tax=Castilleja foliolosa TaxID=1961234 RepID=A0ABD3C0P8_9LAMI
MSDIPSELHKEILLRLPAESLFRLRTVCKSWRRIIDDPPFLRSIINNDQLSFPNLLIRYGTGALYSLSLDSLIHINGEQTIDATHVNHVPSLEFPAATCNGLILILDHYDEDDETWVIWNPLTGDFHEFPQPDIDLFFAGCGIGYHSASDDYRVVRLDYLYHGGEYVHRTLVYSLRLNTWKQIMDYPSDFFNKRRENEGVFLNGAIHWKAYDSIIVLDLATEKFHQLAAPPERAFPRNTRLDAFDGCLVVSVVSGTKRAWVMKDDGVELKWVELFSSVERRVIGGSSPSGRVCPIAYSEKERQLILQHENEIIVWDIEKYSAKKITIPGLWGGPSAQLCPRSIFRFNGIVGGVKKNINEASTRTWIFDKFWNRGICQ